MPDCDKLSYNQKRALAALLSHRTIGEAAEAAKLSKRTLQRYMTDPAFKACLRRKLADLMGDAVRRLAGMQDRTLTTLFDLMQNAEMETTQRAAARELLQAFTRFYEIFSLEERLSVLEERLQKDDPQKPIETP